MGYLVVVMGTLTGLEHVGPSLGLPGWVIRAAVAAALLGLPITVALAWVYDVTPSGILRTGRAHRESANSTASRARCRERYRGAHTRTSR